MLQFNDQAALSFVLSQVSHIEPTVWATRYPDITYPTLLPIDTSAPAWIKSVTYFSTDAAGSAAWLNGRSGDFPTVDVSRAKYETEVHMAGIGYEWDMEEIAQAQMLGINLTADKATAARRKYEELVEDVAFVGDSKKNFEGLLNHSAVTATGVPNGAARSGYTPAPEWSTKSPDDILLDINTALSGVYTTTNTVAMADTLLLPVDEYLDIGTRRLNDLSQTTIMQWVKQNNAYTMLTGQPLDIRAVRQLSRAGSGGSDRMIVYRKSPEVVKMHIPMRLNFLPPQGPHGMKFRVPGIFRLGGVDVRLPKEIRYYDALGNNS
jgi:hypothetical protein